MTEDRPLVGSTQCFTSRAGQKRFPILLVLGNAKTPPQPPVYDTKGSSPDVLLSPTTAAGPTSASDMVVKLTALYLLLAAVIIFYCTILFYLALPNKG